jgi:enoyl-CoA hydratase/carnithine racemase
MNYETLALEMHGGIAIATFTTPRQLNSISERRLDELDDVVAQAAKDETIRALILTGGDAGAFCVGLDLALLDRAFKDLPYFMRMVGRVGRVITAIEALPIPTLAAVNGYCRAGGFEIALGCDFIIMADEARIGDAHTDAGVLPAASSLRLKRRVGEMRAKEVIWTARWYQGAEAVAAGLALKSVPLASLRDEAVAFARTITDKPRACIAANKSVYQRGVDATVAEGMAIELNVFEDYMGSEPYGLEGYTAYREGRAPSWKVAS